MEEMYIVHPNREKASSKGAKAIVTLLLLASAVLVLVITVGGWDSLQGAQIVAIAYVLVFVLMAYFVARWNRGVLPVAAGLAVLLLVPAAASIQGWFDRDHGGYDNPGLPPSLLGLLTIALLPVLLLLVASAMRAFNQKWNIEVEITQEDYESGAWRQRDLTGEGTYEPQPQG